MTRINEFEYYNPNPKDKIDASDCVVRAFCKALNKDWDTIYTELCNLGLELKAMPNSKEVIKEYYKRKGFTKTKISTKKGSKRGTVQEFSKNNPKGTFILDTAGHLVCVKDGKFHDTFAHAGRKSLYGIWS